MEHEGSKTTSILMPYLDSWRHDILLAILLGMFFFQYGCKPIEVVNSQKEVNNIEMGAELENKSIDTAINFYSQIIQSYENLPFEDIAAIKKYTESCYRLCWCYSNKNEIKFKDSILKIMDDGIAKLLTANVAPKEYYLFKIKILKASFLIKDKDPEIAESQLDSITKWQQTDAFSRDFHGELSFARAVYCDYSGSIDSAIIYYQEAITQFEGKIDKKLELCNALLNYGFLLMLDTKNDSAKSSYLKILSLNTGKNASKVQSANANLQLGYLSYISGDFENTLIYCKVAEMLYDEVNILDSNPDIGPLVYNCLGLSYMKTGDNDKALLYINKTIHLNELNGQLNEAISLIINRAIILNLMGKPKEAINQYEEILQYSDSLKDKDSTIISTHNNMGSIFADLKDFKAAEYHHQLALKLKIKQHGNVHEYVAISYLNLGNLYFLQQDYLKSESYLLKSLEILKSLKEKDINNLSEVYLQLGEVATKQKKTDLAVSYMTSALKVLHTPKSPGAFEIPYTQTVFSSRLTALKVLTQLANLYHTLSVQKNDPELLANANATALYDRAASLINEIRSDYDSDEAKEDLMSNARTLYNSAVDHFGYMYKNTGSTASLENLFRFTEASKAVILNEAIQKSAFKNQFLSRDSLEYEKQLKNRMEVVKKDITVENSSKKRDEKAISELEDSLTILNKEWATLHSRLDLLYKKHSKNDMSGLKLSNVQSFLNKPENSKSGIVEYHIGDSLLTILGFIKGQIFCHIVPIDPTFVNQIKRLHTLLSENPTAAGEIQQRKAFNEITQTCTLLYDVLLKETLEKMDFDHLIILPDGELGYLPFQLLLTEKPNQDIMKNADYRRLPYLFKKYDIRYEYSTALLMDNNPAVAKFVHDYIGFAPSYSRQVAAVPASKKDLQISSGLRGSLDSLKYNVEEVESTGKCFNGTVYKEQNATEQNFKKYAPGAGMMHLSMHCVFNDQNPMYSSLVFTDTKDSTEDNQLNAYELYNMHLNTNLAVLSACNTGYGVLKKGEGIMSMARAFKYAGCPNIVMTLWQADDQSSKDLMVNFFQHIKTGEGKSKALNAATFEYLKHQQDDIKTHPFYWANFLLIGDDLPVTMNSCWPWYYWAILSIFLAGGGLLWFRRLRN